nr:4059_t:CDS:10 [Entrophospora candida]
MKKYSKVSPITTTEDVESPPNILISSSIKKTSEAEYVEEDILNGIIRNHSNYHRFSIGEDDTVIGFDDNELLLEEKNFRSDISDLDPPENSPIPMVAAAVSTKDDPTLQPITFRFWVLSTFFTILGAAISQFYYFRSNGGTYSVFFVLLASHVFGKWMADVLPKKQYQICKWKFSLNPGPFNIKEHVCIAVASAAGGGTAYGTDIIAIQQLFYGESANFLMGISLLLSTQMIGYGLAGFLRKFLVRPASMLWPSNLVFASLFTTLHGNAKDTRDKLRFFYIAFTLVFIWQFFPQYMFTLLTSISVLCLIVPMNENIVRFGSGYRGLGFLTFSLDWNSIGQSGPLYTPWWAQINYFAGVLLSAWVITPLLWYYNVLDARRFPLLATYSLNKNGERYNQTAILNQEDNSLNEEAYNSYGPVFLSLTFALGYLYSFIGFSSAISHVMLFYGSEIWSRFRASRHEGDDIHYRMLKRYEDIPNLWYASIFVTMLSIAITLCYVSGSELPWWGLLLAVALACVIVLPIAQIWGTLVGVFINYWTLQLILDAKRMFLDGTARDPTGQWTGYRSQVFNTASIVWGLVGPARTFGNDSMYHFLLWGFPIGFLLPFPIYFLHKKFPNAKFHLITLPLISHGMSAIPGTYTNFITMGLIASFLSQFWAYRYHHKWWAKYNYVLSASLDSGSQIVTMVIFFLLSGVLKVGLSPGNYRICNLVSSFSHQPVIMPVTKRGSQDDSSQCTSSGNKNYSPNKLENNNNNDTSQSSKSIITSHKSPSTPQNALKYLMPNLDFIPINKITSEEIKELGKYHPMMSPVKKRKFDHFEAVNSWRKPNTSELPWMKDNDCNRKYDNVVHRMHFELNDLIEYLSPTEIERSLRIFVIKRIEAAIKSRFSDSEVLIFGSFNSGIYLPTSDIDIVVFGHVSSLAPLSQLADYLEIKGYSHGSPIVIHGAVVPIIKFKEKYTKINIDVSFNQRSVFASVSTIKGYLREWPILGRLLLVLKYFLKHHNLDDPSNGGMGGYTLFCMILNFLQLHPRIADGTLKIDSNDNLGVLLIEFFELYGNQFNYKDLAITIRNGGSYCRKYYQIWAVKIPETNLYNDIARATRKIELIREAFNRAFLRLVNRVGQLEKVHRPIGANYVTGFDNKSILSSILFISEDMQSLRRNLLREYNENGLKRLVLKTSNNLGTLLTTYDYEFIVEKFAKEIEESDYRRNFRVNSLLRRRKPTRFKSFPKYQDRDDYYFEDLYD